MLPLITPPKIPYEVFPGLIVGILMYLTSLSLLHCSGSLVGIKQHSYFALLTENACHHGVKSHMLSDNIAKAWEKKKENSETAALPLTFFQNGVQVLQVQYITQYFN